MKFKLEIEHYLLLAFGLFCVLLLAYLAYDGFIEDSNKKENCEFYQEQYELVHLPEFCFNYHYDNSKLKLRGAK